MSQLCTTCKQIPFQNLLCPTASDIQKAHQMQKKGLRFHPFLPFREHVIPGKSTSDAAPEPSSSVELGSLGRIRARSEKLKCPLCSLFYRTIKSRGAVYANNRPIPEDDDNVVIIADTDFFQSYITEVTGDSTIHNSQPLFVLRRLLLKVYVAKDTEIDGIIRISHDSLAHFTNIAQPCHYDDFVQTTPGPDSTTQVDLKREPRLLFGARKRPDMVDIRLLRRWIDICQTEHDLSCEIEEDEDRPPSHISLIRFIDVNRNCLSVVRGADLGETPYLALSYCWGKDQQVKLDAGNESALQQDGALPQELPQTIQDAILLTRLLGFQHLWVDVLCIMQGQTGVDREDRAVQLSNMGRIYREANVTIVAACGDTADAGLSGLRPGSRKFEQEIIEVLSSDEDPEHGGLSLVSCCTSTPPWTVFDQTHRAQHEDVEWSTWNTRAWTFQERALSRRCLIFTPEQVQWCCDGAIFCEESHFEPPSLYQRGIFDMPVHVERWESNSLLAMKTIDGPLAQLTTNRHTLWTKFGTSIEAYTSRQMTCEGDIYDAFSGLLEAFTTISGESFHWGHPRSRFALSLLWSSPGFYYRLHRRTAKTTLPMTSLNKPVRLPSWAWMGWVGPVRIVVGDNRMETETPEITVYEHTVTTNTTSSHLVSFTLRKIQHTNRFDTLYGDGDSSKSRPERLPPPWKPQLGDFDEEAIITPETIATHLPSLTLTTTLAQTPPGHILFFWTSSVFLHVQRPPEYSLNQDVTGNLGGPELKGIVRSSSSATTTTSQEEDGAQVPGRQVGTVDTMGLRHWNQHFLEPSSSGDDEDKDGDGDGFDPSGLQEFVAIGRRVVGDFLPGGVAAPAAVLALQIRWDKDKGVAYRVNIGEIEEEAWLAARPTWKLVALM